MKLIRLRIRNFRCFKDEISIDFDDIAALIGKNDSGKSTIMEALDIFLNDKDPDKDDASKNGDPSTTPWFPFPRVRNIVVSDF